MVRKLSGIAAVAGLLLVSTALSTPPAPPAPPKYAAVNKIFKAKCVSCHAGPKAAGHLDLTSYAKLMKTDVVKPGKAATSELVEYVNGKRQPVMPIGGKPLSKAEIKTISDWINAGAKEK